MAPMSEGASPDGFHPALMVAAVFNRTTIMDLLIARRRESRCARRGRHASQDAAGRMGAADAGKNCRQRLGFSPAALSRRTARGRRSRLDGDVRGRIAGISLRVQSVVTLARKYRGEPPAQAFFIAMRMRSLSSTIT